MKGALIKLLNSRPHTCALCGKSLEWEVNQLIEFYKTPLEERPKRKRKTIDIDVDHIVPHSHGGLSELFNLQLTHSHCNNAKGNILK